MTDNEEEGAPVPGRDHPSAGRSTITRLAPRRTDGDTGELSAEQRDRERALYAALRMCLGEDRGASDVIDFAVYIATGAIPPPPPNYAANLPDGYRP